LCISSPATAATKLLALDDRAIVSAGHLILSSAHDDEEDRSGGSSSNSSWISARACFSSPAACSILSWQPDGTVAYHRMLHMHSVDTNAHRSLCNIHIPALENYFVQSSTTGRLILVHNQRRSNKELLETARQQHTIESGELDRRRACLVGHLQKAATMAKDKLRALHGLNRSREPWARMEKATISAIDHFERRDPNDLAARGADLGAIYGTGDGRQFSDEDKKLIEKKTGVNSASDRFI
jgi:hypothetical protein